MGMTIYDPGMLHELPSATRKSTVRDAIVELQSPSSADSALKLLQEIYLSCTRHNVNHYMIAIHLGDLEGKNDSWVPGIIEGYVKSRLDTERYPVTWYTISPLTDMEDLPSLRHWSVTDPDSGLSVVSDINIRATGYAKINDLSIQEALTRAQKEFNALEDRLGKPVAEVKAGLHDYKKEDMEARLREALKL